MAKKKKEICPYCGKGFAYLSRHKCKIKEKVEGPSDDSSTLERRIKRIEEKKKDVSRNLKKDEKMILNLINKHKDIYFDDLKKLTNKSRNELEYILNLLTLQEKIKVNRELYIASWTKHIFSVEDYKADVIVNDLKVDKNQKDFIWNLFSRQPCFVCPFEEKCYGTNSGPLNPNHCPWLTDWIELSLDGKIYQINFDELKQNYPEL